ncbi:hypothetical protein CF597_07850 [Pseudomonas sp. PSB1]|nr:hypothetical protein [Pseudomonas sp. PSB1]
MRPPCVEWRKSLGRLSRTGRGVNRGLCGVSNDAIASRLAPTGDLRRSQIHCGSEPARDEASYRRRRTTILPIAPSNHSTDPPSPR